MNLKKKFIEPLMTLALQLVNGALEDIYGAML